MAGKKLDTALSATKDTTGFWVDPTFIEVGTNHARQLPEPGQDAADKARAVSIYHDGQQTPVKCWKAADGKLHLAAGFGRLRSVTLVRNGFEHDGELIKDADRKLFVTIDPNITDEESAYRASILENVRREVSPVNVAKAQQDLRDKFGYSDTAIARLYGYNNTNAVARHKKLLALDQETQKLVHGGKLALDAALKAQELPEEQKQEVVEQAKAGKKVTAAEIAERKAAAIEEQAETASGDDAVVKASPRNAAALKKLINEQIVGNDDVARDVQALFIAVRQYLEGTKTEKTIFNRIADLSA